MPTRLQQLEGLPLRLIALKLSNPGPLAASCSAAHRSLSAPDFQLEWFLHWVLLLAPLRPWQFTVIGWRRLGGPHATAEQLCSFMLRVGDKLNATRSGSARNKAPRQKDQQQPSGEPHHTFMPHFVPSQAVQGQARKLLAQGHQVAALTWLCPGRSALIYPYVAAAGNVLLLQQLMCTQDEMRRVTYPNCAMRLAYVHSCIRNVDTAKLCAYAALRGGNEQLLAVIFITGGASIKRESFQVWQLFRYAVRHSSAACVLQLLAFAPCHDYAGRQSNDKLSASPQHLTMAAARTDPWASDVVGLLLRIVPQKLLAAKYMRPVYEAACRTGHIPVLQQLVLYTAAMPGTQHLVLLLKAAAAAGNLSVWRQLLMLDEAAAGSSSSISGDSRQPDSSRPWLGSRLLSLLGLALLGRRRQQARLPFSVPNADSSQEGEWEEQQQQQPRTQQQQLQQPATLQGVQYLPWGRLASQDKADTLLVILDSMCKSSSSSSGSSTTLEHLHLAADADRVVMAAGLLLGLGGERSVRRTIRAQLSEQSCPCGSFGALQEMLASRVTPAGKVAWLCAHDMLPVLPAGWQLSPAAAEGLLRMIGFSLSHGQRRVADALVQFAWGQDVAVSEQLLVQGCLEGAVRAAGAQQDIGELERLAGFAEYNTRLAAFADSAWQAVSSEGLLAQKQLLFGVAAAWNAAVVLDAEGLPALLGLPLTQHLKLCAAAVLPVMLQAVPQAAGVILSWLSDTSLWQSCTSESGCAAAAAPLALHLTRLLQVHAGAGEQVVVVVMQCLMQLAREWHSLSAQGPQQLMLPCNFSSFVALAAVPLQAAPPPAPAAAPTGAAAGSCAGVGVAQQLAGMRLLAGVDAYTASHAWAHAWATAAGDMPEPELLRLAAPAGKSCSSSSMEPACGGPGRHTWTVSAGAAADPPALQEATEQQADVPVLAARALSQGQHVLFPRQEPRPPPPPSSSPAPAPREDSILPLWAHAALALAAKGAQGQQGFSLSLAVPASLAVQSILQGREGQPRGACEPSVHATAGGHTPSFLVPLAVAAAEDPKLAVVLAPAQPPEHWALMHIISSRHWMQQQQEEAGSSLPGLFGQHQPFWPASALHWLDAAVWAVQQQSAVWAGEQRLQQLPVALLVDTQDLSSLTQRSGSSSVWADHCEQQLLQHQQQLAAGFSDGECGALPGFAAGAADAAVALLNRGLPMHISRLVQQLGGGSCAAQVTHVKAVLAATLAVLCHRMEGIDEQMRAMGDEDSSWVRVKPVAVRKALELGDIDLFTLLSLYDDLVYAYARPPPAPALYLAADV